MRKIARIAAYLILIPTIAAATFTAGIFILGALNIIQPAAASAPVAHRSACTMMINAGACLDPSTIDDLRPPV